MSITFPNAELGLNTFSKFMYPSWFHEHKHFKVCLMDTKTTMNVFSELCKRHGCYFNDKNMGQLFYSRYTYNNARVANERL